MVKGLPWTREQDIALVEHFFEPEEVLERVTGHPVKACMTRHIRLRSDMGFLRKWRHMAQAQGDQMAEAKRIRTPGTRRTLRKPSEKA